MKRILIISFLLMVGFTCNAFSKAAKEFDYKFNPTVDYSKLDFTSITVYEFENAAGEGQDIQDVLHQEVIEAIEKAGLQATILKDTKIGEEKDEFALSLIDNKGDRSSLYQSSPTDLVLSGKLIRLDSRTKKGFITDKKYWTVSIEVFIFSKSLNTIVYKANNTRIFEQKGGFTQIGKKARSTVFQSCVEESFEPFFQKITHPEVKSADEVIKENQ